MHLTEILPIVHTYYLYNTMLKNLAFISGFGDLCPRGLTLRLKKGMVLALSKAMLSNMQLFLKSRENFINLAQFSNNIIYFLTILLLTLLLTYAYQSTFCTQSLVYIRAAARRRTQGQKGGMSFSFLINIYFHLFFDK